VQDHKRADVGDVGPNTGGMGSYSCADLSLPFLTDADVAAARAINERVIATLLERTGHPYRGVLYGGFIATADGVRLIEYNARFADPESLNVLPILDGDLVELAWATATGALGALGEVRFAPRATVCKYLVPASYPAAKLEVGAEVVVPASVTGHPDVRVFWAACERKDGVSRLTGSRSLAVVGIGATLKEAEALAEEAATQIEGPVRHRADIGTEALVAKRLEHMQSLRG
jgi:phosphoribosylamine-glycine ligase